MGLFSFLGVLSNAHINLVTAITGAKKVGTDHLGNVYYTAKPRKGYDRDRRWVIYNGAADASRIPPEWHGWIHHQSDIVPTEAETGFRRSWQKPPKANMTGTDQAYLPDGHMLRREQMTNKAETSRADYEAWTPE